MGVRLRTRGSLWNPSVNVTVYGQRPVLKSDMKRVLEELGYRFDWYEDYSGLYKLVRKDSLLASAVKRLEGMRSFCQESLYDLLMITILLQNTPVRRTETMTRAMLETYGDLLGFDGQRLYCFWPAERIARSSEEKLRALKVGYRAKLFLRASEDYLALDEQDLRNRDDESLRKALLAIYGVGPASVDYLMSGAFHRKTALNTVPSWEAKIFSRILFRRPSASPVRILEELKRRYGAWRGLAAHYLFMDLCWRHREKPIDWFSKLMPY